MTHLIKESALQLIGNTPIVSLDRIYPGSSRLLAKAEFMQPGGSIKDRAAKQIIEDAYRCGTLRRGQMVIEMTSGNM
ncbi:MAG: pyridoxal-phosphate dependent enzyme, partial [Acidobacteriota bacterium]|nr:pyridoxal-phosphate dependent enzyme [Acidobacteriota bacterium]